MSPRGIVDRRVGVFLPECPYRCRLGPFPVECYDNQMTRRMRYDIGRNFVQVFLVVTVVYANRIVRPGFQPGNEV